MKGWDLVLLSDSSEPHGLPVTKDPVWFWNNPGHQGCEPHVLPCTLGTLPALTSTHRGGPCAPGCGWGPRPVSVAGSVTQPSPACTQVLVRQPIFQEVCGILIVTWGHLLQRPVRSSFQLFPSRGHLCALHTRGKDRALQMWLPLPPSTASSETEPALEPHGPHQGGL